MERRLNEAISKVISTTRHVENVRRPRQDPEVVNAAVDKQRRAVRELKEVIRGEAPEEVVDLAFDEYGIDDDSDHGDYRDAAIGAVEKAQHRR